MALKRRIAHIDLDSKKIDSRPIPLEWRHKFLGGRGLSAYLLYKHLPLGCDPLDPDNTVVLGSGLLGGTLTAPFECTDLVAKSPLTRILGRATLSGFFAAELRWAGFDHLVITGRARHPVYLFIHNGNIRIKDAEKIWGMGVFESGESIRKELGEEDLRIICIGPAGENLVRYANVMADRNQVSGRTGMGAVLGSKQVKAIVCRGEMDIEIKNPAAALKYEKQILDSALSKKDGFSGAEGTADIEPAIGDISLDGSDDYGAGAFPANHRLFTDLGMDPLAAGSMLRWAVELYENNIIDDKDTAALKLKPSDPAAAQQLIKQIALRQGFGDILAQGPLRAAEKIGAASLKLFAPVTGLIKMHTEETFDAVSHTLTSEFIYQPQSQKLRVAGNHEHYSAKGYDGSGKTGARAGTAFSECDKEFTGAAGKVRWQELFEMLANSLGICAHQNACRHGDYSDFSMFTELIQLNTGLTLNRKELRDIAYRCYAVERIFNLRESTESLQKKKALYLFDCPTGMRLPLKTWGDMDLKKLKRAVNEYYRINGWSKKEILKLKVFKDLQLTDLWMPANHKGD